MGNAQQRQKESEPPSEQVEEEVVTLGVVRPIANERSRLGGLVLERAVEEDAVAGISGEVVKGVYESVHNKCKLQTETLVAKQKQIHLSIRACQETCSQTRQKLYAQAEELGSHSQAFEQLGNLTADVQRACDQVFACIKRCEQVSQLLSQSQGNDEDLPPLDLRDAFR